MCSMYKNTHTHLEAVQPVPAIGGITDVEELKDTDEHVGVVVRQRTGQQAVNVVSMNVKTATQELKWANKKAIFSTSSIDLQLFVHRCHYWSIGQKKTILWFI